jgi:hypothetical protein
MFVLIIASLLVCTVTAQSPATYSTTTYLQLQWIAEKTLTLMSSDATATTYEKICPTTTTTTTTTTSNTVSST